MQAEKRDLPYLSEKRGVRWSRSSWLDPSAAVLALLLYVRYAERQ